MSSEETPKAPPPLFQGDTYEKLFGETSARVAAAALSHLPLSTYNAETRILDSACGPGTVTKLLLSPSPEYTSQLSLPLPIQPAPSVTGIDISQPMLDQFEANADARGWTTTQTRLQGSQDLSVFRDAHFDAVVMSLGPFMMSDPVAGIREMHRVLKPGGHVSVTTWKHRRPQEMMKAAAEAVRPDGERVADLDPRWETAEHLASVVRDGGFSSSTSHVEGETEKSEGLKLEEMTAQWTLGSVDEIVEALTLPIWTSMFCKGWSDAEVERWGHEIEKQLTDRERETGILELVAIVCCARKGAASVASI